MLTSRGHAGHGHLSAPYRWGTCQISGIAVSTDLIRLSLLASHVERPVPLGDGRRLARVLMEV